MGEPCDSAGGPIHSGRPVAPPGAAYARNTLRERPMRVFTRIAHRIRASARLGASASVALALTTSVALLTAGGCKKNIGGSADTGDIVIGHFASMTGNEANFVISTDNGIKLAVKERNATGGVR